MSSHLINGAKINVDVAGEGEPILLLTGLGGDSCFWKGLVKHMDGEAMTIAVDPRGSGATSFDGNAFSISDLADDAIGILDALDIEVAHVLGWSMGGNVAQEVALRHPERVSSLILMSTYTRRPARSSFAIDTMIDMARATGGRHLGDMMLSLCLTEEDFRRREGRGVRSYDGCDVQGFAMQKDALDGFDSEGRVHMISAPTLVIHGLEDIMVPPWMGNALSESIPGSSFIGIEGAGHIIRPSLYSRHLKDWLNDHPISFCDQTIPIEEGKGTEVIARGERSL